MPFASHIDDPSRPFAHPRRGQNFVNEQARQQKMPHVICCKLHLNTILACLELLESHNARGKEHDIDVVDLVVDLCGSLTHRCVAGKVYPDECCFGAAANLLNVRDDGRGLGFGAAQEEDMRRLSGREVECRFCTAGSCPS